MQLAERQRSIRDAVVAGASLAGMLRGGANPAGRLAIHQRHYHSSLVGALRSRFPATEWLIGSRTLIEAAETFVERQPPSAPCIAEYGQDFPAWLAQQSIGESVPFLTEFAALDWQLGRIAVEVDCLPIAPRELARLNPTRLVDSVVRLQPGLHYQRATWPIDTMMQLFVTGVPVEDRPMQALDVRLEIRGARGEFQFMRLDEPTFAFREAVNRGETLGSAAAAAAEIDYAFDSGRALGDLLGHGLIVGLATVGDNHD